MSTPAPLRGPAFGSYAPDEVAWLLTDLSDVALEAPTEEREEAIQTGGAHYAESLPIEYQPDAAYRRLFEQALAASAPTDRACGRRRHRAGPRRTRAASRAGLARAGRHADRHPACAAGRSSRTASTLAALRGVASCAAAASTPSRCATSPRITTRPTSCSSTAGPARARSPASCGRDRAANANWHPASTPSSRCSPTPDRASHVRHPRRLPGRPRPAELDGVRAGVAHRAEPSHPAPGQFHGAKFYRELAAADVSAVFVDAVSDRFAAVADAVAPRTGRAVSRRTAHRPGPAGPRSSASAREYGIGDVNLVKPGVGETTRVLLRRVPWLVLVRGGRGRRSRARPAARRAARRPGARRCPTSPTAASG